MHTRTPDEAEKVLMNQVLPESLLGSRFQSPKIIAYCRVHAQRAIRLSQSQVSINQSVESLAECRLRRTSRVARSLAISAGTDRKVSWTRFKTKCFTGESL